MQRTAGACAKSRNSYARRSLSNDSQLVALRSEWRRFSFENVECSRKLQAFRARWLARSLASLLARSLARLLARSCTC
eukprot:6201160-Pleurochrysis_carterae.AAC.1